MSTLRDALRNLPDAVFADLLESEDAYLLVIDLPGATAETTDITLKESQVRIEARREKAVPESFKYRREDRSLFLDVDLPIPPDATGDAADATMERGVLELRLPKRGASEEHVIPIEEA
ncbi:MAG: Hsp20/alpha crystallin family protein [Halobacteriales archaeon]